MINLISFHHKNNQLFTNNYHTTFQTFNNKYNTSIPNNGNKITSKSSRNHNRFNFSVQFPIPQSSSSTDLSQSPITKSERYSSSCFFPTYSGIPIEEELQKELRGNQYIPLIGGASFNANNEKKGLLKKIKAYISLSKPRLSSLVLISTLVSFFMANPKETISWKSFYCCIGTSLSIASANAFNQLLEIERDSKMSRTNDRTLPSAQITPQGAAVFATLCGLGGVGLLAWGVNALTSALAMGNIFLYAAIYTPLKAIHPINTWVGAIVGSIPLLMGWSGATGTLNELAPWSLATVQYIWQIPHFLSLAWKLRSDYEKGGYKMLVNVSPESTGIHCLLWSILLVPTGALCSYTGMVDWWFALTSLPLHASMVYYSALFYKDNSISNSTSLFKCSLFHSTSLFVLMFAHKVVSLPAPRFHLKW